MKRTLEFAGAMPMKIQERTTHIVGCGNYSFIHCSDRTSVLVCYTLARYEESMPQMIRVHKRYLINPAFIQQVDPEMRFVLMQSGDWFPIARRRLALFKKHYHTFLSNIQ